MAGLLAWAADVVGGHGGGQANDEEDNIPIVFTEEQHKYVQELDVKAASLTRTIQDLRLRLPPPDISQRLPHLLAHSLASNAALALQLNAHSATKEQAQLREVTLQEENAAYEKAISNCENKIQEKMQEADLLQRKLEEMDDMENSLREELETAETVLDASQSGMPGESVVVSETTVEAGPDAEAAKSTILEKLDNKKKELNSMEDIVQDLEKKWAQVQDTALKQPTPEEMDDMENSLREELETAETVLDASQSGMPGESVVVSETTVEAGPDAEAAKSTILEKLDNKKKELNSMEDIVQDLEKKWAQVQDTALKQPTPAQREKVLDKQLHSLIEQLAAKQAQAEGLVNEIHLKETELETLNGLWRRLESGNVDANTARNRFGRNASEKGSASSDYIVDKLPYSAGGRTEHQQRLMLLRSAFVLYILLLHILVFIKISF